MKKKILFMINSLSVGGAEKSLTSLLSLFDYDRYDVYLLMINRGGEFETLLPEEVKVLPPIDHFLNCKLSYSELIKRKKYRSIKARLMTSISLKTNSKKKDKLHPTQVLWKHSRDAFDVLPDKYDVAIAWGQGTPTHYVAEKVNATKKYAWINVNYTAAGHKKEADTNIYTKYNKIICVSKNLTNITKEVFPTLASRIVTIYDINSEKLINKMSKLGPKSINRHGFVITTVGRLTRQKGYEYAIKSAKILKDRGIDYTWIICGGGPERSNIEKLIKEYALDNNVILMGSVTNPYPYIAMADIYVQTSIFEGFCLTLTEARILNKPIVTTRFDVVYDQMIDGENGIVVDIDENAIADGIIKLATDRKLYDHIIDYQKQEKNSNEEEIEKVYKLIEDEE